MAKQTQQIVLQGNWPAKEDEADPQTPIQGPCLGRDFYERSHADFNLRGPGQILLCRRDPAKYPASLRQGHLSDLSGQQLPISAGQRPKTYQ